MMRKFVILNQDGTVHSLGENRTVPDDTITVSGDVLSYATKMFVNGFWIERPTILDPVVIAGVVRFDDVPDGTSCEVLDRNYNHVAAVVVAELGVIEFQINDAGTYQLDIKAPAPWLSKTLNVVIE